LSEVIFRQPPSKEGRSIPSGAALATVFSLENNHDQQSNQNPNQQQREQQQRPQQNQQNQNPNQRPASSPNPGQKPGHDDKSKHPQGSRE
jgi:hypothetical protein